MPIELQAYGDESGIEGKSPRCIVAGFIGAPRWWDKFNTDWRKVIDAAPDDVIEFHAKHFFERKKAEEDGEKNPFRQWSDSQADAFLSDLLRIIVRYKGGLKPIGCGLDVKDFFSFTWGERRYFTGAIWDREKGRFTTQGAPSRVYPLPLHGCIGDALTHARPDDCKVDFLFDEQRVMQAGVLETIAQVRKAGFLDEPFYQKVGIIGFDVSEAWPGIQAADMLAYLLQSNDTKREKLSADRYHALVTIMGERWKFGLWNRKKLEERLLRKFSPEQIEQMRSDKTPAEVQREVQRRKGKV